MAFDHDFWRHQAPTTWRDRGLHWHCFSWQGTPPKDGDRRNLQLALPPIEIKHWLLKPPSMLARAVHTPEEAADWLKDQPQPPEPGEAAERALYELRVGNNVIWGFWLPSPGLRLHRCGRSTRRPDAPCPVPPPPLTPGPGCG